MKKSKRDFLNEIFIFLLEMIEKEHQAKQTSQILFFVLNEMTRNVVAMMEVAYMSGRKRDLIVMLKPYPGMGLF